jgi:FMN phosphatase YigB (HAD superfamily)
MIGDDLHVDAVGATKAGIDGVFFNPEGVEHEEQIAHDIRHLDELRDIL